RGRPLTQVRPRHSRRERWNPAKQRDRLHTRPSTSMTITTPATIADRGIGTPASDVGWLAWRGTERALSAGMQLDAYAVSIAGRRTNNEDAICARPELGLFIVADGMGGYEGGEVASAIAVEAIFELVRRTASDADVTWPYRVDPRRSITENELAVA